MYSRAGELSDAILSLTSTPATDLKPTNSYACENASCLPLIAETVSSQDYHGGVQGLPVGEDEALSRQEKNQRIRKTLLRTKARHMGMICRTYELKVDKSHLAVETLEALRMLFLEAKWFYNDLLARSCERGGQKIFEADYKRKRVLIKNREGLFE